MKIINSLKYLVISLLVFSTSCQDFTEIEPRGVIAANLAFRNIEDFNQALAGAYDVLQLGGYYGSTYSIMPDIISDNLKVTSEQRGFFLFQRDWGYSPSDDPGMWATLYAMLNRVNTVITRIEPFKAEDEQKHNRILAQALSLRAMVHFDLLRYYGISYDRNNADAQGGVVVVTEVLSPTALPSRSTVSQTYDQIYDDLRAAELLYADIDAPVNVSAGERHYMDLLAMKALRARVSLYAGLWDDAIDYALDVVAEVPLVNTTNFVTMWRDDTFAGENILSVHYSNVEGGFGATNLLWSPSNAATPFVGGASQFTYSDNLVGTYAADDIRFTTWIVNAPVDKNYDFIQSKYPDNGVNIFSDFKIFRTGEMYLILAEAYFNNNDETNARRYLNDLRAARQPSFDAAADGNQTGNLLALVIEIERRKELVIEGHRWFDLRRLNKGVVRDPADFISPTSQFTLDSSSPKFVFPIPQSETFANPNIQQNQGYN